MAINIACVCCLATFPSPTQKQTNELSMWGNEMGILMSQELGMNA